MPTAPPKKLTPAARIALAAVALLSTYAIFGFVLLPWILGSVMERRAVDVLNHEVAIERIRTNPFLLTLELVDFRLTTREGVQTLAADRIALDLALESIWRGAFVWQEVAMDGLQVSAEIDAEGTLNLATLTGSTEETEDASDPFPTHIQHLAVRGGSVSYADLTRGEPAKLEIAPIDLELLDLFVGLDTPDECSFGLSMGLQQGGRLELEGQASMEPLAAKLRIDLADLALTAFQPWLSDTTSVALRSGQMSLVGEAEFGGVDSWLEFQGDASIVDIDLADARQVSGTRDEGDLIRMAEFRIEGIDATSTPPVVSIEHVALGEARVRFAIDRDGRTNFERALTAETATTAAAEPPAATDDLPAAASDSPELSLRIVEITIENSGAWFEDLSIEPQFATQIEDLRGEIRGIDSSGDTTTAVRLEGNTGPHAPVTVTAEARVFRPQPGGKLDFVFRNLDLASLTPYSGHFAGYEIEKGTMDMDLRYTLEGTHLLGENEIFLNQLTLGGKVDSSEAPPIPIALGIALLKDGDGHIDLDLQVEGDVSDPDFSAGGLVWKAFVNVLEKSVTRPFATLGGLVGGDPPPEGIDFEAGLDRLSARHTADLDRLAAALAERPGLELILEGEASNELDGPVLASNELERQLLEVSKGRKSNGASEPTTIEVLTPKERRRAVGKLHKAKRDEITRAQLPHVAASASGDERGEEGAPPESREERKERELQSTIRIGDDELGILAQRRADRIREYLVDIAQVDPQRVEVRTSAETTSGGQPRVRFGLDVMTD